MSIQEDFLSWGVAYLRKLSRQEVSDRRTIFASVQSAYESTQKQLDELLSIRLRGLIDDEMFDTRRVILQKERNSLKTKLQESDGRADRWLDQAEGVLQFCYLLQTRFKGASLDEKRVILETLGSNWILKDKKLTFESVAPYKSVKKSRKISVWQATLKDVRTFFLGMDKIV